MSIEYPMTKSPRAVAREALALARAALPAYSSKYSRKDYTQHQLLAILALSRHKRRLGSALGGGPTSPGSGSAASGS